MMVLDRVIAPPVIDLSSDLSITPEVIQISPEARLHIYQDTIQPVVRVEFVFKAGKWYQQKPCVAALTAKMLKEGSAQYTAKQIADIIDFYGASIEVSHGFDRATLTLYCLSKFLPSLLPLVFELITNPTFPEKEFNLLKQRVIQTLAIDKQKNNYVATELFTSSLYGKAHPYATYLEEKQIEDITLEDIRLFHKAHYSISLAEIFITGDLSQINKKELLATFSITQRESTPIPFSNHIAIDKSSITYTRQSTSNQMQAAIRVGKSLVNPHHQDYAAFYILNHILGGYFGSRLMKNIREDKGYTYGVYSSLSVKEHDTLFTLGTEIKGDKIEEALTEISEEIRILQTDFISKEELNIVKKHLSGKFISDHSTIFDKMDKYRSNVLLNLPPNFFYVLQMQIELIEPNEIAYAASKYLSLDSLYTTVAGGVIKD